ncbi:MAG: hypothetical protein AB4040_00070 [Synechococcus sp.]
MTTATLLLHRSMGSAIPQHYILWAVECLGEGLDTPSLRILAGLNVQLESTEVEPYFQKTCQELNIELQPQTAEPRDTAWLVKKAYDLREITAEVALQMMVQLYQQSQYSDPLLAIWYDMAEELELKGSGHEGCFYPPAELEPLEDALNYEWSLFARGLRLTLPDELNDFIQCEECGHIGEALLKRKTMAAKFIALLPWIRRKPPLYPTCTKCGSYQYRNMANPDVRNAYFQKLEGVRSAEAKATR